jgi:hypothetical protein
MGWSNEGRQKGIKRIEVVEKKNIGKLALNIDQENNNMHPDNRCIPTRVGCNFGLQ